jgi:hypothetical protein
LPNFKGIAAAKTKPVSVLTLTDLDLQGLAPKVRVVNQIVKASGKLADKKTGSPQELAEIISTQISQWLDTDLGSDNEIAETDGVKVFEFSQKDLAAKQAASSGVGLVTDVSASIENRFTKEIFQSAVEVQVEAHLPVVITKAPAPQTNGISVCVGGGVTAIADAQKFANSLQAEFVGTAAAVDKGYVEVKDLVGESGRSISPHIYIGFGVSGAYHHMVGVRRPNFLIAINKDPEAEIFAKADLAIVADADEVLAELVKGIGK